MKFSFPLLFAVPVGLAHSLQATTLTFPSTTGPISITEGSGASIVFPGQATRAPNLRGTLTFDWADGGGFAWSSDVRATVNGVTVEATSGALDNGNNTSLEFVVTVPRADSFPEVDVLLEQTTQRGSTGIFSNFNISFEEIFLPFTVAGRLAPSSTQILPYDGLAFYEIVHRGGVLDFNTTGSSFDTEIGLFSADGDLIQADDDGGLNLDSRISRDLDPGIYYASFSAFNSFFADDFTVTGSVTAIPGASLTITREAAEVIPEPSSTLLLGLCAIATLGVRRRK